MFLERKDRQLKEAEQERDSLALKAEAMGEKLKGANVEFDDKQFETKASAGAAGA